MQINTILLLLGAGIAGGVANAIAGGATLITFPAMVAAGLPPLIANASNSVAVTPGQLIAAITDRKSLPKWSMQLGLQILTAILGGSIGALLLMVTSQNTFILLVPALIGLATLLYAFTKQVQGFIQMAFSGSQAINANTALLFGTTIYGGYFGAGQGIMMLAIFSLTPDKNPRQINALKNLFSTCVSLTTIMIFVAKDMVVWPQTLIMLIGAICGGFVGAKIMQIISAQTVRRIIIIIGSFVTLIYAWRYWF